MCAAAAKAASTAFSSPISASHARLPGTSSDSCGAPAASAPSGSVTLWRSRYSTSTRSAASCAAAALSATTSATASPTKRTFPCASTGRSGALAFMPFLPTNCMVCGALAYPARTASSPVNTCFTPGKASGVLRIHRDDLGVRPVGAHEMAVELAGRVPVRGVLAGARDEAEVFYAAAVVMVVGFVAHGVSRSLTGVPGFGSMQDSLLRPVSASAEAQFKFGGTSPSVVPPRRGPVGAVRYLEA